MRHPTLNVPYSALRFGNQYGSDYYLKSLVLPSDDLKGFLRGRRGKR